MGRDRRRRRAQRADGGRLSGASRPLGAGARAQGAARRRLHAGAAVSRPALPDQPLRLRRGVARRSGRPRAGARAPRLPGVVADPNLWCPLPDGTSVALFLDVSARSATARERLLRAGHPRHERLRGDVRAVAALLRGGPRDTWVGRLAQPERAGGAARPRRRADLGRVRGVGRDTARSLHRRRADQACALRPGRDRRLRGPARPRHRVGETDAPSGGPARARVVLGVRRGRHGPGVLCDRARRRSRAAPRSRPESQWRDCPRRGGRGRKRRVDPSPDRALQRGPEANPGDARGGCRAGLLSPADRRAGRRTRRWSS